MSDNNQTKNNFCYDRSFGGALSCCVNIDLSRTSVETLLLTPEKEILKSLIEFRFKSALCNELKVERIIQF